MDLVIILFNINRLHLLAENGAKNLSAVLVALADEDMSVVKIAEKAILDNITIEKIMKNTSNFISQKLFIKVNLKNAIGKNIRIGKKTRLFFLELLRIFENEINSEILNEPYSKIN